MTESFLFDSFLPLLGFLSLLLTLKLTTFPSFSLFRSLQHRLGQIRPVISTKYISAFDLPSLPLAPFSPSLNPPSLRDADPRSRSLSFALAVEGSMEERMLTIQKKKEDLANMSLSQTMSKKELHEKRMEDLKVRSHTLSSICESSSLTFPFSPRSSRHRLSSLKASTTSLLPFPLALSFLSQLALRLLFFCSLSPSPSLYPLALRPLAVRSCSFASRSLVVFSHPLSSLATLTLSSFRFLSLFHATPF